MCQYREATIWYNLYLLSIKMLKLSDVAALNYILWGDSDLQFCTIFQSLCTWSVRNRTFAIRSCEIQRKSLHWNLNVDQWCYKLFDDSWDMWENVAVASLSMHVMKPLEPMSGHSRYSGFTFFDSGRGMTKINAQNYKKKEGTVWGLVICVNIFKGKCHLLIKLYQWNRTMLSQTKGWFLWFISLALAQCMIMSWHHSLHQMICKWAFFPAIKLPGLDYHRPWPDSDVLLPSCSHPFNPFTGYPHKHITIFSHPRSLSQIPRCTSKGSPKMSHRIIIANKSPEE